MLVGLEQSNQHNRLSSKKNNYQLLYAHVANMVRDNEFPLYVGNLEVRHPRCIVE